jgi:endoglucanase
MSALLACALAIAIPVFAQADPSTPVARYGRLQVLMGRLCDSNGDAVQLKGMSTSGLQWSGGIVNDDSFTALARDWDCDVIRLALYVGENGYATHPELGRIVEKAIDLAEKLGIYVIVDWHVLNPGSPNDPVYSGAEAFFAQIAKEYGSKPNVLYEIMNEPNGSLSWARDLKPYAAKIVSVIRAIDPSNIIIIGSGTWSQDVDLAAADPIPGTNLMYSVHFYAGTHGFALRGKISRALAEGAAVFCTEWGTSEASGDGGPYFDASDEWLKFLDDHKISWTNWSLSDKNETSAAFKAGTGLVPKAMGPEGYGIWTPDQLSASGAYVRAKIRGTPAATP